MTKVLMTQGVALLLLMGSLPLISLGAVEGSAVLWGLGLIVLATGGLLPVASRFFGHEDDTHEPRDCGMEYDDRTS